MSGGPPPNPARTPGALAEVAGLFLKLGCIAFGGPAAHIALMRAEVVGRRKWLADQQFLDLLGAANLIPGPSSTELAIFLGYSRAGWPGLLLAGGLFILPAMGIVLALAWGYVQFGATTPAAALLYGVKPVIVAIIAQAIWGLARTAVQGRLLGAAGAAVLLLYLAGSSPLLLLLAGGLILLGSRGIARPRPPATAALALPAVVLGGPAFGASLLAAAAPYSPLVLFLTFLKIGAVLYGSGYTLLAFLRADFGQQLGWLTDRQLLDAVAVGQLTPGPVFTTATFVGYLVGGVPGALLATLAIFLPSFVFVALVFPLVPRLRGSPRFSAFLDGVNVAALGLMAAVTLQLGQAALVDAPTVGLCLAAALLLIRYRVNSAWLILGGGLAGLVFRLGAGAL